MSYPPSNKYTDFHFEEMTVVELESIIKRIAEFDETLHIHSEGIAWLYKYVGGAWKIRANWMPEGYHLYSPGDPNHTPIWAP